MAKSCTISGCGKALIARGLCGMHYRRWRLYGDPLTLMPPKRPRPPEPRFWSKVARGFDCWEWQALTDSDGYGRFWLDGKQRGAHVVSWSMAYGRVPDGLCVLHRCDNPPCVNLAHLFLGTVADNNADRAAKGRSAQRKPNMPKRAPRFCTVEGCDERHLARDRCRRHYAEWKRANGAPCSMGGCSASAIARGFCHKHYKRWQTHGDPTVA